MNYIKLGDIFDIPLVVSNSSGDRQDADSTPTVTIYEDGSPMGYSPVVTSVATGFYLATISCTGGNGFTSGPRYAVFVSATVDGVVGGDAIQSFIVLDEHLSDIAVTVSAVEVDTQDIQSRIPTALVAGRMDSHVNAMENGTINSSTFAVGAIDASVIATDAIDADAIAANAISEIQSGLATSAEVAAVQADTDNIQTRIPTTLISGRMDVHVGAMGAGVVTASAVATDAIDADALSSSAIAEIQNGLVTSGDLSGILSTLETLEAVAVGRWKVDNNRLTLYQLDGTTPLVTLDLFDDSGNPSMTRIFERVPT